MARRSSSTNLKEQNAISLLHSSIIKGNKSTLVEALKLGCNLKDLSKYGDPPLVAAAGVDPYTTYDNASGKDKMLEIMEILLARDDCDINARGSNGETALHRAMIVRSSVRVKFLIEKHCDVDIRDSRGQTALFAAVGFVEGLEVLLQSGPLIDLFDFAGFTPLMHAMMSESPISMQTMKLLLSAGANPNILSATGKKSALMVSLNGMIPRSQQRVDKSLMLISHGIDVNVSDEARDTALHHAVLGGCVDLVKLLLEHNANAELTNLKGQDALALARESAQSSDIIRIIERAIDKGSRLVPYEEALAHLEVLYKAIGHDDVLPAEKKHYLKSQVDKLERSLQEVISSGHGSETMSIEHKRLLTDNYELLCEEMLPHPIISHLLHNRIITSEDAELINRQKARKTMCIKLLEVLPHRGAFAFDSFYDSLKQSKQDHICLLLTRDESTQM